MELIDINECTSFYPPICDNGRCKNNIGSYTCHCNQGYTLDDSGVNCLNIDECRITHDICGNGTCEDTPGGFKCICQEGFQSTPLTHMCQDINECEFDRTLCMGGKCSNEPGTFRCVCPTVHELSPDGRSCKVLKCLLTSFIRIVLKKALFYRM